MAWYMGVDIGSSTSKGVITRDGKASAFKLIPSGVNYRQAAQKVRELLLAELGLLREDIAFTAVTGQGAGVAGYGDEKPVDIRCCARGINNLFPAVTTVIDIQGQSSQIIRLSQRGQVIDFVVSEKCASGSGRFLDIIANFLQVELSDISRLSLTAKNPVIFTTGCAVFGESEAVSRVAEGTAKEDILAGVLEALADKISSLADRLGLEGQCAICGGGALNVALVRRVEEKLGVQLSIPAQPQMVNALGAAVIAKEKHQQLSK
jgi:(R)-2-hydroxyacyl-CoA dehydratese activating ATPase